MNRSIAVVGLGYVGLPLALDLVEAGYDVLGIDASGPRIEQLRAGDSYVDDVPPGRVADALASGRFRVADPGTAWTDATVAFICVPTPVTASREPDLGPVLVAGRYVRDGLRRGDLVVLDELRAQAREPGHQVLEQLAYGAARGGRRHPAGGSGLARPRDPPRRRARCAPAQPGQPRVSGRHAAGAASPRSGGRRTAGSSDGHRRGR